MNPEIPNPMKPELIKRVEDRINTVTENMATAEKEVTYLTGQIVTCRQYLKNLQHIRRQLDRLTECEGK